ncbi:MAG: hypothetical protein AAGA68_24240 [Pseudomonadota bacterium]
MHTLLRGGLCSLALAMTGTSAWVYFSEFASPAKAHDTTAPGFIELFGEATPSPQGGLSEGGTLELSARVHARSKMTPQVAALAAAGDRRVLRLTVQGQAHGLGLLGGALVRAAVDDDRTVVDLPGRALDRFALQESVERVSLMGVVQRP